MKWIVPFFASIVSAFGLSYTDSALVTANTSPPGTNYAFYPWSVCASYGAYGYNALGLSLGETNRDVAIYPIGPYAAVMAKHVQPQVDSTIIFEGASHSITTQYDLGNDAVLSIVATPFSHWHAVWRGFGYVDSITTNYIPEFDFTFYVTNSVVVSVSNLTTIAVSGGPGGGAFGPPEGCSQLIAGFAKRWGTATNVQSREYSSYYLEASINNGSYSPAVSYGPSLYVPMVDAYGHGQFGSTVGDSGGGLFIRQDNQWWLVGVINNGGNCPNNTTDVSVLYESLYFRDDFWTRIGGAPTNGAWYRSLRSGYFSATNSYAPCYAFGDVPVPNVLPSISISSPTNSATLTGGTNTITAISSDSDGTISEVRFYANDILLAVDASSPYTHVWVATNGAYSLVAVARDDDGGETTSTAIAVTVAQPPANLPPITSISAPANGATITSIPTNILASASDSDGTISEVRFYASGILLSIDASSPYSFTWSPTNGSYSLTSIARDNSGAETTSVAVSVTIDVPPPNVPPLVHLTVPTHGSTVGSIPTNIVAVPTDSDGTIAEVRFYAGTNLLSIVTAPPWTNIWSPTNGAYVLSAIARDDDGAETTSTNHSVTIDVSPPPPPPDPPANISPTVAIILPTGGVEITSIPVAVTADAGDSDGVVTEVRFYAGLVLIGIDTNAPYAISWSPTNGTYGLTAFARDNESAETTSAGREAIINVPPPNVAPSVSFTAPTHGSTVTSIPVTISASASDSDGTVAEVRFYHGGTNLIGIDSSSPFSSSWNPTNGTYTLSLAARDDDGAETMSTNLTITIAVPPPNVAPSISITNPTFGATIESVPVTIEASASDSDGTIAEVRFYDGASLIGIDTGSPYSISWTPVNGTNTLTAVARDDDQAETRSAAVIVVIATPPPEPPVIDPPIPPPPPEVPPDVPPVVIVITPRPPRPPAPPPVTYQPPPPRPTTGSLGLSNSIPTRPFLNAQGGGFSIVILP